MSLFLSTLSAFPLVPTVRHTHYFSPSVTCCQIDLLCAMDQGGRVAVKEMVSRPCRGRFLKEGFDSVLPHMRNSCISTLPCDSTNIYLDSPWTDWKMPFNGYTPPMEAQKSPLLQSPRASLEILCLIFCPPPSLRILGSLIRLDLTRQARDFDQQVPVYISLAASYCSAHLLIGCCCQSLTVWRENSLGETQKRHLKVLLKLLE